MNRSSTIGSKTRKIFGAVVAAVTVASLVFSGCASDEEEDDGGVDVSGGWSKATALVLTGNSGNWTREFTANRQEAWFRINANGRYELDIRDNYYTPTAANQPTYTVDVKISVMDENDNFIADISNSMLNGKDVGGNNDHIIILTDLEGVYYIKVEPWQAGRTGSFYIGLERKGPVTGGEDVDNAIPLVFGAQLLVQNYEREITSSRPERWFEFTSPASGSVTLTVYDNSYTPTNATVVKPTVDVKVTVMDADMNYVSNAAGQVMNARDIGSNSDGIVEFDGLTAGDIYYVKVEPWQTGRTGFFYIGIE